MKRRLSRPPCCDNRAFSEGPFAATTYYYQLYKMGKNKPQGGAFNSFVNSIITDRVKLTTKAQPAAPVAQAKEETVSGDLALLQTIVSGGKAPKEKPADAAQRNGPMGLGYKVQGQAELDGATQMQRLKNQIRKTQEQEELERQREKGHIKESVNTQGKGEMIEKKKAASDDRGVLLKDKQEKKRLKKEKQKEKKKEQKQAAKPAEEKKVEEVEAKPTEWKKKAVYRLLNEGTEGERYRKRTKTRSKQKNKKRDNRPEDVKRTKLAEKGIAI